VTSVLGGGPEGGFTVGSFESGPLVGVCTFVVVLLEEVELEVAELVEELSDLSTAAISAAACGFSLPGTIVLVEEPLAPQPVISTAPATDASTSAFAVCGCDFVVCTEARLANGVPPRYDRPGPC
jgi:hypothetical protein